MGSTKGTTKSQGRKDELDRFYTDINEAKKLVAHLVMHLCGTNKIKFGTGMITAPVLDETEVRTALAKMVDDDYIFVEPSAGDGAFSSSTRIFRSANLEYYQLAILPQLIIFSAVPK